MSEQQPITDSKPVETMAKPQGKKGNGKKKDNPKDFNPGSSAPIIGIHTQRIPGVFHSFSIAMDCIDNVTDQLSLRAEGHSADAGGVVAPAVIQDSTRRIGRFAMAKKITFSADDKYSQLLRLDLSPLCNAEIDLPDPIKTVVEGVGQFNIGGAFFVPFSAPVSAFNILVHALGNPDTDGLPVAYQRDTVFVSSNMTSWKHTARDYFRDQYNAWTGKEEVVTFNGVKMRAPQLTEGFGIFANAMDAAPNVNAQGRVVPVEIVNALHVAQIFEAGLNVAAFPNAAETAALNGYGVYILANWDKNFLTGKIVDFKRTHVNYINRFLGREYTLHKNVRRMEAEGKPWQIVNVEQNVGTSPLSVDPTDASMALCVTNQSSVLIRKQAVEWFTQFGPDDRAERLVASMSKNH